MILNRVQLHNFMSYGDATLDLTDIPVLCLTGHNGAGKSALLDAVTWAIFEEARASSDDLVRLSEREMWVEVTFVHERRLYRVRRSRFRAGRAGSKGASKGNLELMVGDQDGTGEVRWQSLTAASMKETGKVITDLLRMDYETFLNSVYLRQGRSDAFALKPPSERKQVLSEILGLSYFDRLRDEARESARFFKGKIEILESSASGLEDLEKRIETVASELLETRGEYDRGEEAHETLRSEMLTTQEKLQQLKLVEAGIRGNEKLVVECRQTLQRLAIELSDAVARRVELDDLLLAARTIDRDIKEFEEVKSRVEKLDRTQLALQELQEKKLVAAGELSSLRSRLEVELEQKERELESEIKRQESLRRECESGDKIREQFAEYQSLIASEADMAGRQEAFAQLGRRKLELAAAVQEARIRLEAEVKEKEEALKNFQELAKDTLAQEGTELDSEARALDALEAEFEICEKRGLAIKADLSAFDLKVEELKKKEGEKRSKIDELNEHAHSSICPLCSAPIVDRAAVIARYSAEIDDMRDDAARQLAQKALLEEERDELRSRYVEMKKALGGRKDLDKKIGQYNERTRQAAQARESLGRHEEMLSRLKKRLETEDYANIEKDSLAAVTRELAAIDFDPLVYNSLSGQIRARRHIESRHQKYEKDLADLQILQERLPDLEKSHADVSVALATESYGVPVRERLRSLQEALEAENYSREEHTELKVRLTELMHLAERARDIKRATDEKPLLDGKLEDLRREEERSRRLADELDEELAAQRLMLSDYEELAARVRELAPRLESMGQIQTTTARKLAVLDERLLAANGELARLSGQRQEIAALKDNLEDYNYLAEALGKKGIQAVIIENAIPEIESEANRILSRLTDNKMHVALVTQAKTRAGTISETLDLVIGDELGTRNYELYSGGEAFKVNFALRIALSRLLARRSGARLETLIIDEGFGSQDDASRERLVKAIKMVQQEFSRVVIITHISDVRDMFPVQINVTKKNGVSKLAHLA